MIPKVFEKSSKFLKSEPDSSSTSVLKQQCDVYRKSVVSVLTEMKSLSNKLKDALKSIDSINNEISFLYSSGNSIIQPQVKQFVESIEGLSMKSLPLLENEIECCETYFKDLPKKYSHYSNNSYRDYYEQRFDSIDPCVLLYMKLVIGFTGEKVGSYQKLIYAALQDGLNIPKSFTLLSSFKTICESRIGSLYFQKFLKENDEERNIQFYREVMLYNNIVNSDIKEWVAKDIFEEFICVGSIKELQLTNGTKQKITNNYVQGKYDNLFDPAKDEIFELMENNNYFERFKNSIYFEELTHRITPLDKLSPSKDLDLTIHVPLNDETYIDVAKYLIPYNLVGFTDEFVSNGYTTPSLMAMITEKEIQRLAPNPADMKRLNEYCELAKSNSIKQSKVLTKEAITKVKSIQNNFIKYVEAHNDNVKNTLSFIEYVRTTPLEKMTVSQVLTRSEMAFIELKAKHHVAYRLLKKCDQVNDMQPVLAQCQNALISILVDEHLDDYNNSGYWKPQTRKSLKLSVRALGNKMCKTPDFTQVVNNSSSPTRRAITPREDELEVIPSPRVNEEERIKNNIILSCRKQTENDLQLSLESRAVHPSKQDTPEATIEELIVSIKTTIQPRLVFIKQQLFSIKTNEEYENIKLTVELFDKIITFLGDEAVFPQQPKVFSVKTNDLRLKEVLLKDLNKLDAIEVSVNCVLQKLSSLIVVLRKGCATIMKYTSVVERLSTSF